MQVELHSEQLNSIVFSLLFEVKDLHFMQKKLDWQNGDNAWWKLKF